MLKNKYYSEADKKAATERFLEFLDSVVGKEPYKAYDSVASLAKELGVSRTLIYNIKRGKNSVTFDLLATFQNMFGSKFDARWILTNKTYVTSDQYNIPKGFVVVEKAKIEEIANYGELLKVKANQITSQLSLFDL